MYVLCLSDSTVDVPEYKGKERDADPLHHTGAYSAVSQYLAAEGNHLSPVVAKFLKAPGPRQVLRAIMHEFTGKLLSNAQDQHGRKHGRACLKT